MDDLLSACDTSSPLTRTSSDPNLNNHCQEARAGLEPGMAIPRHRRLRLRGVWVGGPQQAIGGGSPPRCPAARKTTGNKPFKSHRNGSPGYKLLSATVPQETKSSTSEPEIKASQRLLGPSSRPSCSRTSWIGLDGTEGATRDCPEKAAIHVL